MYNYYEEQLNLFKDRNNITLIYDEDMNVNFPERGGINILPITKYLSLMSLFLDKFYFTCNHGLFKFMKQVFYCNEEQNLLFNKYSFKYYYEINDIEEEHYLVIILTQEDELNTMDFDMSIRNIIMRYRNRKYGNNLIIITDKHDFKVNNERKPLEIQMFNTFTYKELYNSVHEELSTLNFNLINLNLDNIFLETIFYYIQKISPKLKMKNVVEIFLSIDKQFYSPLWDIFSLKIESELKSKDIQNQGINLKNIFKFLNINIIINNQNQKIFRTKLIKGIEQSFLNKQERIGLIQENQDILKNLMDFSLEFNNIKNNLRQISSKKIKNLNVFSWIDERLNFGSEDYE